MKNVMTPMERMKNMLSGKPTDRPLYSAWGHIRSFNDLNAADFARATIDIQQQNRFDFIKVMSNPYYMVEDMGVRLIPAPTYDSVTTRDSDHRPVMKPSDWNRVRFPKVGKGALAREEEAIKRVLDYFDGSVPVLPTIFTPIMSMGYVGLHSDEMDRAEAAEGSITPMFERYLTENEKIISPVLEELAACNLEYMERLLKLGVSGFFYCTEHARDYWKEPENFTHFEKKYDLMTLNAVSDASMLNILHVCGTDRLRMDWVLDYPVNALNWDDCLPGNPSLTEVRAMTDKVLVGGLDRRSDLAGTDRETIRARIEERVRKAVADAGDRLIISGGCDWSLAASYRFYILSDVIENW